MTVECSFVSSVITLDYTRIDTLKDHLKSQKHALRKQAKQSKSDTAGSSSSSVRQVTLSTVVKAKDICQDFCLELSKCVPQLIYPWRRLKK